MARYPLMLRQAVRAGLIVLALAWTLTSWTPAWAGDAGRQEAKSQANEQAEDVDPVGAARAAWDAAPLDLSAGIALQDALRAAGEEREAIALFKKLFRANKTSAVARFLAGRVEADQEGVQEMRAALDGELAKEAGARGALYAWIELAKVEVALGNGEEAARAAGRVADLRGKAADWIYLAWIQERLLDQPAAAMRSYGQALAVDSKSAHARSALALLKAGAGEKKEALGLAKAGVLANAEDASAHLHLGLVQAMCGDPAAARVSYAAALARAGRDVQSLTLIASAYMDIEEHNLAGAALRRALEISPEDPQVLTSAGLLALAQGEDKEARARFKEAAKASPRDGRIAFLLAVSEERLGLGSKAISSYRRALQLDPDRLEFVTALALALRAEGSYTPAIRKFKDAMALAPEDGDLPLQLGITYMQQKKYRPAREAFAEAARLTPKSPRPWFYLAIILGDHLSKPKDAYEALRTYAELGGKEPTALKWLQELRALYGEQ
jgi:tetratricopeptide (TPR) repeat protein